MAITALELVVFAKSKVGTPYVYGSCGQPLTLAQINCWAGLYPSTYTVSYINKAKTFIGKRCTDCSGLISWATGIRRNSSAFRTTATEVLPINKLTDEHIGYAVWKPGHIGVYIGNGEVVEAKGINYGTIISKLSATPWQAAIKLKDIDYGTKTSAVAAMNGWQKQDGVWRYYINNQPVKSDWIEYTDVTGKTDWYYFDENGNLYTGWLEYTDKSGEFKGQKFWYYFDEDWRDDRIGRMVRNRVIVADGGRNYFMDEHGHMVEPGHTVTFKVVPNTNGGETYFGQLVLKSIAAEP